MMTNCFHSLKFGSIDVVYFAVWYSQMERALNLVLNQTRIEFWLFCLLTWPRRNIEFSGKRDMEKISQEKNNCFSKRPTVYAKGFQSIQQRQESLLRIVSVWVETWIGEIGVGMENRRRWVTQERGWARAWGHVCSCNLKWSVFLEHEACRTLKSVWK